MKTVWTKDDVDHLVETLKAEPGFWNAYVDGEVQFKRIEPQISQWIGMVMHRLFPAASYDELTDLLLLFRKEVRTQLGLEW
ncbi:hypothetical protein I3J27_06860 [Bradyrhizobium xenonodulans]|uniref:Uncharacterized protein n=1 Tax=Bradyrhizobium xenonodulans TaxID=2736875 RepID=A0ABY7MRU7_9BRAD|nr:hypothetical protein [Bradyrhizobium xenonodulans]WBL80142.1 hypothetical protein I3J27_06860 [Bradyrhizobium xenonodulans]